MNSTTKTIIEAALKSDRTISAKRRNAALELLEGSRCLAVEDGQRAEQRPSLLKLCELASELSCTRQTAARLVKEGLIEPVVLRRGSGTERTGDLVRYRRSDFERIVLGRSS